MRKSDDSAVSIVVSYVLNIAVAVIVAGLIFLSFTTTVETIPQNTADNLLEKQSSLVVSEIRKADRMGNGSTLEFDVRDTGFEYTIKVDNRKVLIDSPKGYRFIIQDHEANKQVENMTIENGETVKLKVINNEIRKAN